MSTLFSKFLNSVWCTLSTSGYSLHKCVNSCIWCDLSISSSSFFFLSPPPQRTGKPAAALHLLPLPDFALRLQTKPLLPVSTPFSSLLTSIVNLSACVCVCGVLEVWTLPTCTPLVCQDPLHGVADSPGALCDEARLPGLLQENVPQQHRLH